MTTILRDKKLGSGAYGEVYKGVIKYEDYERNVAVKRNYGYKTTTGMLAIRELNFLALVRDHPCIIHLRDISFGNPFGDAPLTPIPKGKKDMREDSHHFILEYADFSLDKYRKLNKNEFGSMKIIMCQILLGLEFCHSKKILHRDLTPSNILIVEEDGTIQAKICDFGLSCRPNNYTVSTPGAVTCWYRAPEICCEYENYSYPSDIWSVGCIFWELVTNSVFIEADKDKNIFLKSVSKLPEEFTKEEIKEYVNGAFKIKSGVYTLSGKRSFKEYFKYRIDDDKFNETEGTLKEFADLMDNMLRLYPSDRFSATGCLNHKFFDKFNDYKKKVRTLCPPETFKSENIKIINCLERRFAANLAFQIYNDRRRYHEWYKHEILFHGFRLFDEYLSVEYKEEKLRKHCKQGVGRLFTKDQTEFIFYVCLYIMYKFYCCLVYPIKWEKFFPSKFTKDKFPETIKELEQNIVVEICDYKVFKDTFLEYLDDDSSPSEDIEDLDDSEKELRIKNCLIQYGSITTDYTGTTKRLYEKTFKKF